MLDTFAILQRIRRLTWKRISVVELSASGTLSMKLLIAPWDTTVMKLNSNLFLAQSEPTRTLEHLRLLLLLALMFLLAHITMRSGKTRLKLM